MSIGTPKPTSFAYPPAYPPAAAQPAAPKSLETLQRELGGFILNASRIDIDPKRFYKLNDGEALAPTKRWIPRTGLPALDQVLEKAGEVAAFIPPAAVHSAVSSGKDALIGGLGVGLASGLATGIFHLFAGKGPVSTPLTITAGLAVLGSLAGGMIGMAHSTWQNLRDLKYLLVSKKAGL